jgi:L-seryl-tRNA(Ser) seleniumtransferase
VQESLQAGADLVCFSGDKLLGGPQAGIIIGSSALLKRVKKHPLARAVRADKLCLAALSATLTHYLRDEVLEKVPVWQMISSSPERIQQRADAWRRELGQGELVAGQSTVGGGSLPGETLPTTLLALTVKRPNNFAGKLRSQSPPTIVRVESGKVMLDPRTVLLQQDTVLLNQLNALLT